MQTKTKNNFKAVEFMRQVRNELSDLLQSDKRRFHDELKQSLSDFLARRKEVNRKHGLKPNVAKK